jgi:tetrahydromethanopterin S-methyltransferase subunit F
VADRSDDFDLKKQLRIAARNRRIGKRLERERAFWRITGIALACGSLSALALLGITAAMFLTGHGR